MAPEQLEGKEADARTDIFAFGCVLYEMATGKKAFSATSQASLITAIMSSDPAPISSVQPMSPPALDRVVKTCLAKDPEDRWQSAADVKREIQWIGEGSAAGIAAPAAVVGRRRRREGLAWGLAAAGLVAAAVAFVARRPAPAAAPAPAPPGSASGPAVRCARAARGLSRRPPAALHRRGRGRSRPTLGAELWIPRRCGGSKARSSRATRSGRPTAARSPSSRAGGCGESTPTAARSRRSPRRAESGFGGSWNAKGEIVFCGTFGGPLMRVPAAGGTPKPATALDAKRGDAAHLFPSFLPDGRHFTFAARNVDPRKTSVALGDLDAEASAGRILFQADSSAVWATAGLSALRPRRDALRAEVRRQARGPGGRPRRCDGEHPVLRPTTSRVEASAGGDLLVYGLWPHERRLVWVDRQGRETGTLGPRRRLRGRPDFSRGRSGRRVHSKSGGRAGISTSGSSTSAEASASRVSTERSDEFHPVWTPDGQRLIYVSDRAGFYDLYARPAGGGPETEVIRTDWDKRASEVTPDGGEPGLRRVDVGRRTRMSGSWLWRGPDSQARHRDEGVRGGLLAAFAGRPMDRVHVRRVRAARSLRGAVPVGSQASRLERRRQASRSGAATERSSSTSAATAASSRSR